MVTPAPFKRSKTIDGSSCSPVPRPATRRMRTLAISDEGCCKGDLVYVGPNPVIKKTTSMLRRRPTKKKQQQQLKKLTPKSASKTDLKQCRSTRVGRSRRNSLSDNKNSAEKPKAPRRKRSNPFLRGGLVGQSETTTAKMQPSRSSSRSLSPMTTRSQSQQKGNNPFLRGGLIGQCDFSTHASHTIRSSTSPSSSSCRSVSPMTTRSRSRQKLQASVSWDAPRVPSRKASIDDMHMAYTFTNTAPVPLGAPRVPSRKESIDDMHMAYTSASNKAPPSMPHRKASNPFLNKGFVVHSPLLSERIIMTRSKSRQQLQDRLSVDAPQAPSRKESIPEMHYLGDSKVRYSINILDMDWDKLSLSDTTTRSSKLASPVLPLRKQSLMELDAMA